MDISVNTILESSQHYEKTHRKYDHEHRNTLWSTRMLSRHHSAIVAFSRDTPPLSTLDGRSRWESSTEIWKYTPGAIPRWYSWFYQFLTPSWPLDMVYYRKYLTCGLLHLCDILSAHAIHNEKTRFKYLFFWTSFACSSTRCHGNHDSPSWTDCPHTDTGGNHFFDNIAGSLYACHETKYSTKIPVSHPPRLSRSPWNIWWRCLGDRTRSMYHHTQLYPRIYHTVAHSSLCSPLICSRYLWFTFQLLSQMLYRLSQKIFPIFANSLDLYMRNYWERIRQYEDSSRVS